MTMRLRGRPVTGVMPARDHWMAVGSSADPRPRSAGREAAAAVAGSQPSLLLAFFSTSLEPVELLAGIMDEAGDVPLIGCSTAGAITAHGSADGSVAVMALGGNGFSVATAAAAGIHSRMREAGSEVAGCLAGVASRPHRVLIMLSDGLAGEHEELVRGAYAVTGAAIPMVGGLAADDLRMARTLQLHGDGVLTDSVVAAALGSDSPFGVGIHHGYRPFGEPMLVTASAASQILTLDDEPALDVYLGRLEAPADCYRDAAAFTRFAVTHPLGLSRRSGQRLLGVVQVDLDARTLACNAHVPHGAVTSFMESAPASHLESADRATRDAVRALGDQPAIGLLAFEGIGRRRALGEAGTAAEIARMREAAGAAASVCGFYTYGEIARIRGGEAFHSQSLVALAIG